MLSPVGMITDAKTMAARAFVRSLNILLKFARLYGFDHKRTATQFETTWNELHAAIPADSENGLLLGATGSQLLLDGVPLEAAPAERSFAQLLSAAGLASIHFSPRVTRDDLERFARAFPTGGAKPSSLAEQLKTALAGASGIRLNEIRFVAEDSSVTEFRMAAQLTARTLGADADQFKAWMNDPEKLLQLILAAEGSKGGPGGSGGGSDAGGGGSSGGGFGSGGGPGGGFGSGGSSGSEGSPEAGGSSGGEGQLAPGGGGTAPNAGSGQAGGSGGAPADAQPPISNFMRAVALGTLSGQASGPVSAKPLISGSSGATGGASGGKWTGAAAGPPQEGDILGIVRLLSQVGQLSGQQADAVAFQQRLSGLPIRAHDMLRHALASLAAQAPTDRPETPMLLKLAEHLAIRFALDRYERGEVRVNAVRQLLDRMSKEMDALRKILLTHEEKMARAGILVESHAELLDRQFWAAVPDSGKRSVLLSKDAWCIPARNVKQYVKELLEVGENESVHEILVNYASCIKSSEADARRNTAIGLSECAELYGSGDGRALTEAIQMAGQQLIAEADAEVQSVVSAAFVRLSQEAGARRNYAAMQQALDSLESMEYQRPGSAQNLRPRVGLESRLPELVEEAVRAEKIPEGLAHVLHLMPLAATDQVAVRFSRSGYRKDCERLVELAQELAPESLDHLREAFRSASAPEAVERIGLLSRLDALLLEELLPARAREWQRSAQDRALRQIASGGAPERGRLLLVIFDVLDPLILPLAIDEIGMSGEASSVPQLLQVAEGAIPEKNSPYLRLKAFEALGRLRAQQVTSLLRQVAEGRQMWRWAFPSELRIAAVQALQKVDPEWAGDFLPRSGLTQADLVLPPLDCAPDAPWFRQRRYTRLRLTHTIPAVTTNLRENCRLEVKGLSLSGGVANIDRHLAPGTHTILKLQSGMRGVHLTVLMRDYRAQEVVFEIVDMNLDDRSKLRRLLAAELSPSTTMHSGLRNRRAGRGQTAVN